MKKAFLFFAALAFFGAAVAVAAPPVETAEPVVEKWGEEAYNEIQREGLLFWRDDKGLLYIGDGLTPGGKAVCVGVPADLYSWTNDVAANGKALKWNDKWSQRAEGDSLSVRFGADSFLHLVGTSAGDMAGLYADAYDPAAGTLRIIVSTTDPEAVVEVSTNLLAASAWQVATNAAVTERTDATTTWTIDLLGTPFETYRVRASTTRAVGIYAERPLYANEGVSLAEGQPLTMGDNTWTNLPDMESIEAHVADTDNPHGVTAEQVGALPVSGGTVDGDIVLFTNAATTTPAIIFARGSGGAAVDWKIQNQAGTLRFQNRPGNDAAWRTPGVMFSPGGVVAATVFSGGGDDLTVGTNTLGSWVPAAEAAVASVERRVEVFERTDTCLLWWTTNLASETTYWVPTNFPTRRLEIRADRGGLTNLVIAVNGAYDYGRDVEIDVCFCATDAGHGIIRCMGSGTGYVSMGNVTGTTSRHYTFVFDNATKTMRSLGMSPSITSANLLTVTCANGSANSTPTGPCTVEEWLVLHPEWTSP